MNTSKKKKNLNLAALDMRLPDISGIEVVTASNGEAALALYNNSFDVILTDIVMPVMGGIRLIKELKQINPDVKCLAITGFSDASVPTEIPLIRKPVSSSKLVAFVRNELIN